MQRVGVEGGHVTHRSSEKCRPNGLKILILMIVPYPGASAGANHMQRLARGLRSAGHDVLVVAPRAADDGLELDGVDACGVRYTSFAMPRKPPAIPFYPYSVVAMRPRMLALLEYVVRSEKWDAAIVEGDSWWVFEPARKYLQKHGVKFVPYPVEWFAPTFMRLANWSWIDQWLWRIVSIPASDALLGITREWNRLATEPQLPFAVVPAISKFDDSELPSVQGRRDGRFRIVFLGRFVRRELPLTIFAALELVLQAGVDLEFVVIGAAPRSREERKSHDALHRNPELAARTRVLGWLSDEQLQAEMGAADAFVLLRENDRENRALFPTRLPEYLATGKPVVVSDVGDLALYLSHDESAIVIPAGDQSEALAQALLGLSRDAARAAKIGIGGRRALSSFSQTLIGSKLGEFLRSLTSPA